MSAAGIESLKTGITANVRDRSKGGRFTVLTDDESVANALHLFASLVPDEFQLSRLHEHRAARRRGAG